ncbi:MAG: radical SAM protein [Thermodesulfobacteriota bacterium]
MSHLFGPVPSRRLGRSLGVDLVPPKTCTYDCLYCEVGPTTHLTKKRRAFEAAAIIRELQDYLRDSETTLDYLTITGSGEPTLNLDLKDIVATIRDLTTTPVAILTNGSLLYLPEVRRDLAQSQVILPSLDAAREETYRAINRPVPGLTLEKLVFGLKALRREFAGQIWLEVLLLKGLNDTEAELTGLRRLIREIAPDKVQLNTAVRPVVEDAAQPLTTAEMAAVAAFLGEGVEVIAGFDRSPAARKSINDADFLETLARRPMTARDLAQMMGLPLDQVEKRLARLQAAGLITRDFYHQEGFYRG